MKRLLIPIVLFLVGIGGGVGAGFMLGGAEPEEVAADEDHAGAEDDGHGDEEAGTHDEPGDGEHGDGHGEEGDSEPPRVEQTGEGTEYVRLNNQFVVPIVRNGSVRSLVVLGLTIEVTTGQNNLVFDQEPRLRDSFLRVLFAHANTGGFDGIFTEADAMEPLREGLREAAQRALGREIVFDVLITDITRQDA
ncbi:flagellar basal body-associated protein FliL [Rhodobacterales bacterium HKCCE4037]|nr:flagellar basal body-associated protein FliL [Rhodobacterales bacterium HKCCE4037]